ncbi:hypothetical protein BC826DRAFT_1122503 [Russula brevipes]|nr:hypothetical protein BC826DRAFT_1122503 [Russula brevipes]
MTVVSNPRPVNTEREHTYGLHPQTQSVQVRRYPGSGSAQASTHAQASRNLVIQGALSFPIAEVTLTTLATTVHAACDHRVPVALDELNELDDAPPLIDISKSRGALSFWVPTGHAERQKGLTTPQTLEEIFEMGSKDVGTVDSFTTHTVPLKNNYFLNLLVVRKRDLRAVSPLTRLGECRPYVPKEWDITEHKDFEGTRSERENLPGMRPQVKAVSKLRMRNPLAFPGITYSHALGERVEAHFDVSVGGGQEYVIGVGGEGNVMRHSETVLEVPPDGGVGCLGLTSVKATINQFNVKEAKGYEFGFEYCGAAIERQRSGVPHPSDNVRHVGRCRKGCAARSAERNEARATGEARKEECHVCRPTDGTFHRPTHLLSASVLEEFFSSSAITMHISQNYDTWGWQDRMKTFARALTVRHLDWYSFRFVVIVPRGLRNERAVHTNTKRQETAGTTWQATWSWISTVP